MVAELGSARDGVFAGGLPYLAMGSGEPLVYLSGGAPNHRNPPPGFQRQLTLRTIRPFARAGFEVFFTSRWPGMSIDITWPEVAAGHAKALTGRFAAEELAGPDAAPPLAERSAPAPGADCVPLDPRRESHGHHGQVRC